MPKFPGPVQHNNPSDFIVNLTENQVKGLGVFADAAARSSLNANMRVNGFLAVLQDVDKLYIYNNTDLGDTAWATAGNWVEIGSGNTYTLPIASASALGGIKVGANLSIDAGTGILSATDTNTTYSAAANGGLTLTGTAFSHTDTSTQASSTNTGRTYIQSIGLDTYGHVTSLSTATETVTSNTYTAGNGLTLSSSEFNVGGTANRITVSADAVDIASTYVGQTSITTLGTITSGTWNGSQIANAYIATGIDGSKISGSIPGNSNNVNGTVAITNGGTGSSSAPAARTALGLAIGTDVQAYDPDLAAIAALTGTSGLLRKTAADTWSLDSTTYLSGTVAISNGGTGATTVGVARSNILPAYSGNNNKVLRVNSSQTDVEWSCISKDMFCVPGTTPSTTNHIVTSVYRDGQWRDIEINGLYSAGGTVTVANDSVVVKSVNSVTPISGAVTLYGTSIARSTGNPQTIQAGLVSAENSISTNSQDILSLQEIVAPISKNATKTRFGFSGTSAALETTETTGSFFRGSTGYFFSQASPGIVEIKVLDDSVTPVQRTIIYGEGRVSGAVIGVHNTTPSYPVDITGNTRVTGNIIVTGTVDGVDISELKNTVDNITVGGTEEIELFSYFIS